MVGRRGRPGESEDLPVPVFSNLQGRGAGIVAILLIAEPVCLF